MGLPRTGRGDGGGGHTVCGYIYFPPPEHICTIYYDKAHYGTVSGGGLDPGIKGVKAVVAAGFLGNGGYTYSFSNGEIVTVVEVGRGVSVIYGWLRHKDTVVESVFSACDSG